MTSTACKAGLDAPVPRYSAPAGILATLVSGCGCATDELHRLPFVPQRLQQQAAAFAAELFHTTAPKYVIARCIVASAVSAADIAPLGL